MEQELGIPSEISEKWDFRQIGKFKYSSRWDSEWIEREIDHVLMVRGDTDIKPNLNEVEAFEWLDLDEVGSMVAQTGRWSEEMVAPLVQGHRECVSARWEIGRGGNGGHV